MQIAERLQSTEHHIALLPTATPARLDHLRREAARCRVDPHLELFEACRLLTPDPDLGPAVFAHALLRTLGQALGKKPVIHRPGTASTSFDEDWLMRVIDRMEAGDHDSVSFLLVRRVPQMYRRSLAFLLHGLIDRSPADRRLPGSSRAHPR